MSLHYKGKVSLDGSGWEAGVSKIEHSAEHMASHVSSHLKGMVAGAFGVAAIEEAVHRTIEYGEKIVDTARRVGVGIEALQEFGFAARQNGSDLEALVGFIEKLNSARIDPKKLKSFEKLGITNSDLHSMGIEDMMMKLSVGVRGMSSQAAIGPLRDIGGRGAGEMIPMLKDDMEEVRKKARELGVIMSSDTAVKLKFIGDQFKVLSQVIVVSLGPAVAFLMEKILRLTNVVRAAGAFYSTATGSGMGAHELLVMMGLSGASKSERGRIFGILNKAGAASDSVLSELNAGTDAQMAELMAKQKSIEHLNATPVFADVFSDSSGNPKSHQMKQASDSLISVGNFLGNGRSAIEDISRQQLAVLQSIDRKLSPGTGGGVEWRWYEHG